MAQIARTVVEKASASGNDTTDNVAELRKRTAEQTVEVAHEAAERAEGMARATQRTVDAMAEVEREVAHQAAAGTSKLAHEFVGLANEQVRHNLETLKALSGAVDWTRFAKAVDWDQVLRIQRSYLQVSLERTARLTRNYLELGQAVMTSAASAAQHRAKKTA